ncbi:MAG: hypothetical protein EBR82_43200 [Caulobacteraceae bacterium]|nr:hypothetical protein [Caulobacteraceae bacterium]
MALKKTSQTAFGIEVADAYHRVEGVRLSSKTSMSFQVRSYKDNSGLLHFADAAAGCAYDINGENPIKQAYVHLKTTPEFADAQDC